LNVLWRNLVLPERHGEFMTKEAEYCRNALDWFATEEDPYYKEVARIEVLKQRLEFLGEWMREEYEDD
jgi:hypothetical protein